MALYAISDLHLSADNKKSMEVFGDKWNNYMNRIKVNWEEWITEQDFVVIPGDICWATYIDESIEDFRYLNSLPGKKVILKGNHDYWWTTMAKLNEFLDNNNFNTIKFLQNDCVLCDNTAVCGTRGWLNPGQNDFCQEDLKIFNREIQRLKLSLEASRKKEYKSLMVALHYPPFESSGNINEHFLKLFLEYNVSTCVYGHLHGPSQNEAVEGIVEGINFIMAASDYINFIPIKLY